MKATTHWKLPHASHSQHLAARVQAGISAVDANSQLGARGARQGLDEAEVPDGISAVGLI